MHGMHRIGQPEMAQRVGGQEMAEFVVDVRRGRRMVGQERQPQDDGQRGEQRHRPGSSFGEAPGARFESLPPHQSGQQQGGQQQLQVISRAEPQWIIERVKGAEEIEHAGQLA